jgi:hypothetical protein
VGFDPWYMPAVESDILMGRRGVLGWDNVYRNPGLLMHGPLPPVPTFWESVAAAWERNPWKTLGYLAAGLVIVVGGILFTAATFGAGAVGLGSLIVGGAISGFGMSFGITGAITHDLGAATKSGLIGAAAGAIGGAVTFGAMSMVASAAGFGPASAAAINAAMKSGGLGMQAAMGGVGGFAGGAVSGFAGGVMGGLADGKSWGESLNMGLEGAGVGGILGGALGAGLPFIAVGLRGIKNFGKDAISATKAMRSGGQAIGDGEGVIVTTGEQVAHQPAVGFRGWWRNFQVSRAARKMGYYGAARYVEEIGTMPNGQTPLGGMHNPKTGQILLEAKAFDRAFLAKSDLQLHSWRAILAHEIGHSFKGLIPHNTLAPLGSTVGISPRDAKEFWASYFGATVVRNVSKADAASLLRHAYREYR